VHSSEGAINNAIKEAMNAIDKYAHVVVKGSCKNKNKPLEIMKSDEY